VIETSFQVHCSQKGVRFPSKLQNSRNPEVVCFSPEVVCFSRTVSDRNVVPSALDSEKCPLPVEIEKFWKTGSSLFLENGKC
jgi:hypothetical protein